MLVRNGELVTREFINGFAIELMYPLEYIVLCVRGDSPLPVGYTVESIITEADKCIMLIDEILNDIDYTEDCFDEDTYERLLKWSNYWFGSFRVVKHEAGVDTTLFRNGDISFSVEFCCYFSTLSSDITLTIEKEVNEKFETVVAVTSEGIAATHFEHLTEDEKDLFEECIDIFSGSEFYHRGSFEFTN